MIQHFFQSQFYLRINIYLLPKNLYSRNLLKALIKLQHHKTICTSKKFLVAVLQVMLSKSLILEYELNIKDLYKNATSL